jgi:hypothetical protein
MYLKKKLTESKLLELDTGYSCVAVDPRSEEDPTQTISESNDQ